MPTEIVMPKLSDTMEEGRILKWLKKPGDRISAGEVVAEVETDKADMELEAESAGVLSEIVVPEGDSASVGQVIARIGNGGEPAGARKGEAEASRKAREPEPPPRPKAEPAPATSKAAPDDQPRPAPAARATLPPPPAPRPATSQARSEELSKIRRTVARRMAEAKRDIPHFYMTVEIEMTACAGLKDELAKARPDGPGVSYTHLLIRGVALALGSHPRINARYAGEDRVEFSNGVHIGIAVALDGGLIVPVLHDCAAKNVFDIAAETRALVERVRQGKPQGDDLSGGTFTISNLGMYPIEDFAAVINPPQAAVLATGAVSERVVVRNGSIVGAPTMRGTLSSDHRVIDGAEAARFLQTLKELLESPLRLVI